MAFTLDPITQDQAPEGWDWRVINNQGGQGRGVAMRHGPRPPFPDDVAPRGTPQWRAAFQAQQDWIGKQLFTGATLADMGFDPNNKENFPIYQRLREGYFGGFRRNWFEPTKNEPHGFYDFKSGALTVRPGYGGGYGVGTEALSPDAGAAAAPTTGMISGPGGPVAPSAPTASFGGAAQSAPGQTTPIDNPYSTTSNRKKKGLLGIIKPSATLIRKW